MSITNYSIAVAERNAATDLAAKVGAAISDGWQPYGAVVMTDRLVYQVLVKGTPADGGGDYTLPAATADELGGVKMAAAVDDSSATDVEGLAADFNGLLAALRAAGIVAAAE